MSHVQALGRAGLVHAEAHARPPPDKDVADNGHVGEAFLHGHVDPRAGEAAILDADPRHRQVGGADEDDADRAAAHVEAA
jgi:hypothetical protein